MPGHVKRIECCYCGASTLVDLNNIDDKTLICPGCNARMSADRLSALAPKPEAPKPILQPIPMPPAQDEPRQFESRRDDRSGSDKRRRKKKRKGFFDRMEDIWDDIEDIFD